MRVISSESKPTFLLFLIFRGRSSRRPSRRAGRRRRPCRVNTSDHVSAVSLQSVKSADDMRVLFFILLRTGSERGAVEERASNPERGESETRDGTDSAVNSGRITHADCDLTYPLR